MSYAASPFDAIRKFVAASGFTEEVMTLSPARALIDEDDLTQPDGMPFFIETHTGAPFNCEGYMFVCSLRDGGTKLVVHGPDSGLASHIESCLMDHAKVMAWALEMASEIDWDFDMAGPDGQIHDGIRKGYICEK